MNPPTDRNPILRARITGDRHWHTVKAVHPEGLHLIADQRNRWIRWDRIAATKETQ